MAQELGHFSVEDFTVPDEELEEDELEEEDPEEEPDELATSEPLPEQPARKRSATSGDRYLDFDINIPSKINLNRMRSVKPLQAGIPELILEKFQTFQAPHLGGHHPKKARKMPF
ncbi:hypothetical protein FJU08_14960 [Martelella alba]|uniref:Uncharacterized protein n=1 Tax=Martelella alba TaxID=2590451 RepID=A0A506U992_9HYPH|nr:hypothetical protein [Martelella alba]TPW29149.1 hypothetical protein FJU08_14960 [Martelella alba]